MRDTFFHEVFDCMWNSSPLLKKLRVRPQIEGRQASFQREDGKTIEIEYEKSSVSRKMEFENAKGLSPEEFLETAGDIGKEMGQLMEKKLFIAVNEATEECGNVVNCEGGGITFEKYLEMVSMVHTDFDDQGNPREKTLMLNPAAHTSMLEALRMWDSDPEKRAAMIAVINRKREEHHEREARRRMVD